MRVHFSLLSLIFLSVAFAVYVPLPEPYADHCILDDNVSKYDPAHQFDIPWFDINLDLPPNQRWTQVATIYKDQIHNLIGVLKDLIIPIFPDALKVVDEIFGEMNDKIPMPYRDEIKSISDASGVPLGEVVLYNIFYEIFTVCTSIIGMDGQGNMYHARNLDFGLFLGWNATAHEWRISSVLRTMIININWIQDGKILYKSNNFAGFIGIYNGLKVGKFSITANERFQAEGGYVGILKWLLGDDPNGKWMTWLTRETMEQAKDFYDAKDRLMNTPMLSPVYYILGGVNPYEGVVITRSLNGTDLLTTMDPDDPYGWYLLETNYDLNQDVLFLDDRNTPGNNCMRKLGQHRVGFEGIYNVLSSRTNLNKLTTYTVLMQVSNGKFETHTQSCPGYCWPF